MRWGGQSKLLVAQIDAVDTELKITGNSLADLSVEKKVSGETWRLEPLFEDYHIDDDYSFNVMFSSNNEEFDNLTAAFSPDPRHNCYIYYNDTMIFEGKFMGGVPHCYNEAYRTITLEEPATGELLAFLRVNAIKIS